MMKVLSFSDSSSVCAAMVDGAVVVDLSDDEILGVEIIGYSGISGRPPVAEDVEWMQTMVNSVGVYEDDDVLSIRVRTGPNTGQKELVARFGFDESGRLVYISMPR